MRTKSKIQGGAINQASVGKKVPNNSQSFSDVFKMLFNDVFIANSLTSMSVKENFES